MSLFNGQKIETKIAENARLSESIAFDQSVNSSFLLAIFIISKLIRY